MKNKVKKPTKADIELAKLMRNVVVSLNRRIGTLKKSGCDELHSGCFDCKTRVLIGFLNEWIDILED